MSNSLLEQVAKLYPKSPIQIMGESPQVYTRGLHSEKKKCSNFDKWKISIIVALLAALFSLAVYMVIGRKESKEIEKRQLDKECMFLIFLTTFLIFIIRLLLEIFY